MTLVMVCPFDVEITDAAVGVDDLAVDPAGRAGQEGDGLGDVVGLAEPLQRRAALRRLVDDLLRPCRRGTAAWRSGPGATALTVTSRPRISLARISVIASTAPLVAA